MDGIEAKIGDSLFIGGASASAEDHEAFESLGGAVPSPTSHPNTFSWYSLVSRYTLEIRGAWKASAPVAPAAAAKSSEESSKKGGEKQGKKGENKQGGQKKKKAEAKPAAAAADDDFGDLFDGTDDGDAAAAAAAMKAKATAAKLAKAPPVGKSLVVWDVKIIDTETDLNKLGRDIIAQVI